MEGGELTASGFRTPIPFSLRNGRRHYIVLSSRTKSAWMEATCRGGEYTYRCILYQRLHDSSAGHRRILQQAWGQKSAVREMPDMSSAGTGSSRSCQRISVFLLLTATFTISIRPSISSLTPRLSGSKETVA